MASTLGLPVTNDPGLAARRAALGILSGVQQGLPFDAARDRAVEGLEERDRRLAHELAAGVLRKRTGLDESLAPYVPRGLRSVPRSIRSILRLGAYQLHALDRVPPHAAVSTCVDLARQAGGERQARFVNAVLRRLAAEGPPGPQPDSQEKGAAPAAGLARAASHPAWLVSRWIERFGEGETRALLEWNNTPPTLVVQPARATLQELRERWLGEGELVLEAPFGAGLILHRQSPRGLSGYATGDFVIQDPAQAMVVRFAGLQPDGIVYDACAAPGGKAIALGREARVVIAADGRRARVERLAENLKRCGSGRELPLVADAANPPLRPVDAVLLDAPCLGTGTFARHPDARWRVRPAALARLAERQARLLDAVALVVRQGGLLVYATCSLEPEENELQIERFLAAHPDFQREPPSGFPAEVLTSRADLMTLPQRHHMDGAFAARLRRAT